MKLDKSKPYGEVFGDVDGRRYEQGGAYFDATGHLVGESKTKTVKLGPKSAPMPTKAELDVAKIAEDQVAAQLGG